MISRKCANHIGDVNSIFYKFSGKKLEIEKHLVRKRGMYPKQKKRHWKIQDKENTPIYESILRYWSVNYLRSIVCVGPMTQL